MKIINNFITTKPKTMGLSEMTAFSLRSKFVNESTEAQNPIALSGEVSDLSKQKTAINLTAVSLLHKVRINSPST
jgi:hypothetical protein